MQMRFPRYWASGIWNDYGIHKKELQRRWAEKLPIAGDVIAWIDFHSIAGNREMIMKVSYEPTDSGQLEHESFENLFGAVNILINKTNDARGQAWHSELFGRGFWIQTNQRRGEVQRSHKCCVIGVQPTPKLLYNKIVQNDLGLIEVKGILKLALQGASVHAYRAGGYNQDKVKQVICVESSNTINIPTLNQRFPSALGQHIRWIEDRDWDERQAEDVIPKQKKHTTEAERIDNFQVKAEARALSLEEITAINTGYATRVKMWTRPNDLTDRERMYYRNKHALRCHYTWRDSWLCAWRTPTRQRRSRCRRICASCVTAWT